MLRQSLIAILFAFTPTVVAAVTLPQPNQAGDYPARTSHRYWVVVDRDPNGINCRWSETMPANWYDPSVQFPQLDIENWQVVKQYKRNQVLLANTAPAGFAMIADAQGKPWLKVTIGPNEQICLVRANAQFIQPYEKTN
jgi:hypothetical protein